MRDIARKQIAVAVRGMAGGLGTSLSLAFAKSPDIDYVAGIGIPDRTLADLLRRQNLHEGQSQDRLPKKIYVDGHDEKVAKLKRQYSHLDIVSAECVDFSGSSIIIDATTPGTFAFWRERYERSDAVVLAQAGEAKLSDAMLISPPQMQTGEKLYKVGDCIVSAVVPVISALLQVADNIQLTVLTQRTAPLLGIPTSDSTDAVYFLDELGQNTAAKIRTLTGFEHLDIVSYLQTVGIRHYVVTINLETKSELSGQDLVEIFNKKPRINVLRNVEGTHDLVYLRRHMSAQTDLSPINVCIGTSLGKTTKHRIHLTIDHQTIAVGANLDAVRIIGASLDPVTAMEVTDVFMRYRQIGEVSEEAQKYVREYTR